MSSFTTSLIFQKCIGILSRSKSLKLEAVDVEVMCLFVVFYLSARRPDILSQRLPDSPRGSKGLGFLKGTWPLSNLFLRSYINSSEALSASVSSGCQKSMILRISDKLLDSRWGQNHPREISGTYKT